LATLFLSYSHQDEKLRKQFEVHLSTLKNQRLIEAWHDRLIKLGDEFDKAISAELDRADVILLLVSPHFLASSYIRDVEITRAIERHKAGEARVIPIILRPCDWHDAPFGRLVAGPKDGKPITTWPNRDAAFLDVVRMIRTALPTETADAKEAARIGVSGAGVIQAIVPGAPGARGNIVFKVMCPGDKDFVFPLHVGDKIKIGRSETNDLFIQSDMWVSRYHCIANVLDHDSVRILDQDATNTPVINGVKSRDGVLRLYQTLQLGHSRLFFTRGKCAFKIKSPRNEHSRRSLYVKDIVKIGRADGNDIVILDDSSVSPYHCVADVLEDSVRIESKDPTSTITINGIEAKTGVLRMYQTLRLGHTELVLVPDL
jgi:pSer/pThr/pTyr-binding forkhead associated (FHA) protein